MLQDKLKRRRRRRDVARMRRRAKAIYPHDPKGRAAEYLAVCSCWMCGNPRRHREADERLTLQERRIAFKEEDFATDGCLAP